MSIINILFTNLKNQWFELKNYENGTFIGNITSIFINFPISFLNSPIVGFNCQHANGHYQEMFRNIEVLADESNQKMNWSNTSVSITPAYTGTYYYTLINHYLFLGI